ncbi:phage head closure protein [Hansschlegelia zhihuaiae]|uniref:Head-tail adaptor protein n=1 Tax=Hansschlegelia zhihuaiae TaxID=405005 RepID=A0A4Q0M7Y9_9HYPH|nr:phage head closure protein [Hansschlegelia zhihuaiae]RXF69240.1 head-tail adaptor protein [Hansschlegelia zhihuaiae]
MRAGRLDRAIAIERLGAMDIDLDGVPLDTWTTLATVPAEVVQVAADEFLTGAGVSQSTTIIFRVRYLDGLQETDRVRFNGRAYGVTSLVELGRREGLEIRATTKAADALG